MPVKIRLSRWGQRNNPFYAIVVANARQAQHRFLEQVGTYNPIPDKNVKHVEVNIERIKYWLGVGAQPTERVNWLLAKYGLIPHTERQLVNTGAIKLEQPQKRMEKKEEIPLNFKEKLTEKEATLVLRRYLGID